MMASEDSSSEGSKEGEEERVGENLDDSTGNRRVVLVHGHNRYEWLFLTFAFVDCFLLFSLSMITIISYDVKKLLSFPECIGILIAATACIAFIFAVYGMWYEHQYDMYSHCFWAAASGFCIFMNYFLDRGIGNKNCGDVNCEVIFSVIFFACWFFTAVLAFKATHAPDWIEFRLIGVSDPLAVMYKNLCYFLALLKSHSIFIVFCVLYSTNLIAPYMSNKYSSVYYSLVVIYAFLVWILGKMAVYKESSFLTIGFYIVNTCFILLIISGYVIWAIVGHYSYESYKLDKKADVYFHSSIPLSVGLSCWTAYLMVQLKKVQEGYGYGLRTQSFLDLVSRNSNNLLANERTALMF